ncbi:MAG: hypothetical protein JWM34_4231 [Ilumatobacteraceae bacterium]|nr:hypothetical protein [Ilumatobacteraceae bacterium]
MAPETVRTVGPDDRSGVVACFDDAAPIVFAVLSRLTAGDANRAAELLVDTFAYLERSAAKSPDGIDVDRRWLIGAAHSVYVVGASPRDAAGAPPTAALAPIERVVASLRLVEERTTDAVAALLGTTEAEVDRSLALTVAVLTVDGATPAAALRRGEVWFDDVTRARARASVAAGDSSRDVPVPAPTTATVMPVGAPSGTVPDRSSSRPPSDTDQSFRPTPEFVRPR